MYWPGIDSVTAFETFLLAGVRQVQVLILCVWMRILILCAAWYYVRGAGKRVKVPGYTLELHSSGCEFPVEYVNSLERANV